MDLRDAIKHRMARLLLRFRRGSRSDAEKSLQPLLPEPSPSYVDWSRRDVLIGTLRNPQQLDICKEKRFYYIPMERIQDSDLPIHYVALFQTPRIFPDRAGIYCYGEVLRTGIVRRKNIREIPVRPNANPETLYYRFAIREWIPLPRPILPKEDGFVHEFTNRFLLENMEYIPELLLRSEEEYRLYSALKRRAEEALTGREAGPTEIPWKGSALVLDRGMIRLMQDGALADQCPIAAFSDCPCAVFRRFFPSSQGASVSKKSRCAGSVSNVP